MEIPGFFSEKEKILTYDYHQIEELLHTEYDESYWIENLSIDKPNLVSKYFQSILLGYNHLYISSLLNDLNNPSANLCLPLLHEWDGSPKISNLIIISHPDDAERICKMHIKKTPVFKELLNTSIISTTDNKDWKEQRHSMTNAFLPYYSLEEIFPESLKRAKHCSDLLVHMSEKYSKPVNMSEFFLNETQAQLQKALFGFSDEFEEKTNKRIRNVFAGIETEYLSEFSELALKETMKSNGPASKLFHESKDIEKSIGNIILFAFAGHDTTGHTLTWLLYELCKHPKYKEKLIQEIDHYWLNYEEPTYDSFYELPFMTKCIVETLRMWPALANGTYRELEKDDYVIGHNNEKVELKKGTYCQIINWTRHRNPELWDDPDTFNPEREFEDSEIWHEEGFGGYNISSDRFSPFTYGPRNCLGKNFSHMEMRLILLYIFKNHDFEFEEKQRLTINDPKYQGVNTFTMGPADVHGEGLLGMYVYLHQRKSKL
ncbi:MAG: hypothetical protein CL470_05250 [Acidimicrobiaceae bacterium]|nr:hypothetical protein [Acidimicrobiaceae bacterium]|tara:strand:+ start:380 stop:1843 length:1464 start_codon:yes stop_codon:yes gene_type:complete